MRTGCSAGLRGGWSSASWAQQHLLRGSTDKLRLSTQAGSARMWNGTSQGHQAAETCSESSAMQVSFPVYILPQAPSQRFSQDMLRMLLWLHPWYLYLSETPLGSSRKHWHTQLHPFVPLLHSLVVSLSCNESRACRQCSYLPFLFKCSQKVVVNGFIEADVEANVEADVEADDECRPMGLYFGTSAL